MSVVAYKPAEAKHFANEIVNPATYADEARLHETLTNLRNHEPVFWAEPDNYRPFWIVTKHADILEIEKQNDFFLNDPRTTLIDIETEKGIQDYTGGSHILLRTLVHMDNPDHRKYRALTQSWFMPPNLAKLRERVDAIAEKFVNRMVEKNGACDFVQEVAVWYPLHVIMSILGVPEEDESFMLTLTQQLFGTTDPDMQRDKALSEILDTNVVEDFFNYFTKITDDRRKNPKDDVASVIANAQIDGKPIGDLEAMSYYIIIASAGHDTTSSATAGGLLELIRRPEEMKKIRDNRDLMPKMLEECFRWVSPVKHFFRTPIADYEMRGKTIKKDQNVFMIYPSGNRDEEVFDDPFSFHVDRDPNKHLAFGHGAHLCLGMHLARLEMAAFFNALFDKVGDIELDGDPRWVESNFVSGLKEMPIRFSTL